MFRLRQNRPLLAANIRKNCEFVIPSEPQATRNLPNKEYPSRFCLSSLSLPTLDLYTAEGEGVTDAIGTRIEPRGIEVEACRKRVGGSRKYPVVTDGSLIVQLPVGVFTVS